MKKKKPVKQYQFDVALSFAGEDRKYVEKVANELKKMEIRVFYDKYETVDLWGKNLYDHFENVYQNMACYSVLFISKHYAKKVWANHERKNAQARAFMSGQEYILPARFDNTKIPGVLPTIGYVGLKNYSPKEFAKVVKQKIGYIARYEFFPDEPDLLFKLLKATNEEEKNRIYLIAYNFFSSLKLMTLEERILLVKAIKNTCPSGPPKNVHLNIDLLSRLTTVPVEQIKASFSRLDCLGFRTSIYQRKQSNNQLCKEKNIIEIEYQPLLKSIDINNATFVAIAIINTISEHLCPSCEVKAIENLDFSVLSSSTGFSEKKEKNK